MAVPDHLGREFFVDCCKDRTLSVRHRLEKPFNGVAIPVFSADTRQQAEDLITGVGSLQYEEHPQIPGKPWRKINVEFKRWLEIEDLPYVTLKLQGVWDAYVGLSSQKQEA